MVSPIKVILILVVFVLIEANITKVTRKNVFLSRRRRYLTFPLGSTFIITLSHIKAFLQVQPRGWNILLECDVPFALPHDTRLFTRGKRQVIERKNLFKQLEVALTEAGLSGKACVERLICDVLQYKKSKGKSLVKDLLYTVFAVPEENINVSQDGCTSSVIDCPLPLLEFIIGSLLH